MVAKTTKWQKKANNVSEFKPKDQPAIPESAKPGALPAELVKQPEIGDYFPLADAGEQKKDGRARILLMVDKENGTMFPLMWFNASIIEVAVYAAEANRIAATELAMAVMRREDETQKEKEQAVLNVLKRFGIMDDEPAEPVEDEQEDG